MSSIVKVTNSKGTLYKAVYELPKYIDGGRRRTSKTFPPGTTLKEVKAFLAAKELERNRCGNLSTDYNLTFEQFADMYFETYTQFLSPSTLHGYQLAYNNSKKYGLKNYFGKAKLRKITPYHLQQYVNLLSKNLSAKSIKNYSMLLGVLFKLAVQEKIIHENPMRDVKKPPQKRAPIEAYNFKEFNLILKLAAEDPNPDIKLIMFLALLTGCRRGELAALKWTDIDWEESSIRVDKCRLVVDRKEYIKEPKTNAGNRTIFVPEQLMKVLREYKRRYEMNRLKFGPDFVDSGYVICKENGEAFSPQGISNNYLRFMSRHSDKIRYLKFHGLRHTYASILCENGTPIKTVQHNLGHSDVALTLQIYAHSYKETQKEAANQLGKMVFTDEMIG